MGRDFRIWDAGVGRKCEGGWRSMRRRFRRERGEEQRSGLGSWPLVVGSLVVFRVY